MLIVRRLLYALVICSGLAWSASPEEKQAEAGTEQAEEKQRGTEESPLFIKGEVTAKKDEQEAKDEAEERETKRAVDESLVKYTGHLAFATYLLFLFTAGLFAVTYKLSRDANRDSRERTKETERALGIAQQSSDAASRSAKIAEDALLIGERAHVFVTDVRFESPVDSDYAGPPMLIHAIYALANHGRTPAVVTAFCYESLSAKALPDIPNYRDYNTHSQLRRVYPRDHVTTLDFLFKTPIDGLLLNDIHCGTRELFSYGYVKYTDIFGYQNTVGYCWRYNVFVKRFLPDDHPAYNYRKVEAPS